MSEGDGKRLPTNKLPYTNQQYKTPLETAFDIAAELRAVYIQYRRGKIDNVMATKSTYILRELNQVMVVRELQERLLCLEEGRPYMPPEQRKIEKKPKVIEGETMPEHKGTAH